MQQTKERATKPNEALLLCFLFYLSPQLREPVTPVLNSSFSTSASLSFPLPLLSSSAWSSTLHPTPPFFTKRALIRVKSIADTKDVLMGARKLLFFCKNTDTKRRNYLPKMTSNSPQTCLQPRRPRRAPLSSKLPVDTADYFFWLRFLPRSPEQGKRHHPDTSPRLYIGT